MPKISIAIPFHWMPNWQFYLGRCLKSIEEQTFTNYEIVLIKYSTMPITSNRVIESAQGEFIKILYMDDYFSDSKSLERINDALDDETEWLVTGCVHDYGGGAKKNPHYPKYTENISTGNNGIGGPSVLTIRNKEPLLFDTELSWLLDCDLYKRYHDKYGEPKILNDLNVVIGIHVGQVTNTMPDSDKQLEAKYVENKYA